LVSLIHCPQHHQDDLLKQNLTTVALLENP
jgi:hypothetical protein